MKPPAFQFYPDDFMGGTCDLTTLEVGCYIRLLCYQWSKGKIPDEKHKLKLVCGVPVTENVLKKFQNGKNPRLEKERKKQALWRKKSSEGGKKSAEKRASKMVQPPLQPLDQPKGNIPSPVSSLQSPEEREQRPPAQFAEIPNWEEFWGYCQSLHCGLVAEWFAKDKFEAANADQWKGKADWRAYARRCKGWWENDGRPMKPINKNEKNQKPNPRNAGVAGNLIEIANQTAEFVKRQQQARREKSL